MTESDATRDTTAARNRRGLILMTCGFFAFFTVTVSERWQCCDLML